MSEDIKHDDDDITSHNYDGIKELNNKAPFWIVLLFMVTIGFSLIYLVHYFGYPGNGNSQASEYDTTMVRAQKDLASLQKKSASESANVSIEEKITKGAELYIKNGCLACHGALGEGNAIGPNLTDNVSIHGCSIDDIKKIITEGNPVKGMTSFKTVMSSSEIENVAVYIKEKLVGSNPANAKASQGTECK